MLWFNAMERDYGHRRTAFAGISCCYEPISYYIALFVTCQVNISPLVV